MAMTNMITTPANDNANKMPFRRHTHYLLMTRHGYQDSRLVTPPVAGAQAWAEDLVRRERGVTDFKVVLTACN